MCRTRWAAKPSRSRRSPATIPTAGGCSQVEIASPERIAPFCPHFGVCGGCAIQHWDAAPYRAWKRDLVVATLAQAGIDCDVAPLVDAHGAGRRRITLHGRIGTHEVLKVGYAAAGSHDIIPIDRCPILDPHLNGAIEAAWALAEPLITIGKPLDIQVTATDSGLDVDVRGSGPLSTAMITALSRIAEQHRLARLTRHGELVLMRTPPTFRWAAQVALPPGSFLQATVAGEETLAALVAEPLQARQADRRPVLRRRPVRAAAGGEGAGHRLRQRRRRGRRAAEGRDLDLRAEAGQGRDRATCSAAR